ncbi:hypothetical protein [uncultured Photobacterium sp.]|uniref:hypothetical protein n=1 Tax=uncultured Photobacterium sp. TaxID=173973 RepID=UPI0026118924|nr:hypothetical protein [uncultured Photobacterium sp.]
MDRDVAINLSDKSMVSLPVGRVWVFIIMVVTVLIAQITYSAWTNKVNEKLINEKVSIINSQSSRIDTLESELLTLSEQLGYLKQELNSNSAIVVDKNSQVAILESKLKQAKRYNNKYKKQLIAFRENYQLQLDNELASERLKLSEAQSELDNELRDVRSQKVEISSKINDIGEWERKKHEFDKLYTNSAMQAQNEERVSKLMDQFNRLRIDLDVVNECDKDYLYRYNEAKSILNHIRTFIQKYEMNQDYYFFVISNDSLISSHNRKLCLRN